MLTVVFGGSAVSRTQVQLRYNRFKEDKKDDNDYARATTDENIDDADEH